MRLSAETELDPRTVMRAVELGIGTMKSEASRRCLRKAAAKLRIIIE